jgi:hypothetical protein
MYAFSPRSYGYRLGELCFAPIAYPESSRGVGEDHSVAAPNFFCYG